MKKMDGKKTRNNLLSVILQKFLLYFILRISYLFFISLFKKRMKRSAGALCHGTMGNLVLYVMIAEGANGVRPGQLKRWKHHCLLV